MGTLLCGWCMTNYHESCMRVYSDKRGCPCDCNPMKEDDNENDAEETTELDSEQAVPPSVEEV